MNILKVFLVCAALVSFVASALAQAITAGEEVKTSGLITDEAVRI
jgi:hypothetical protein